MILKKEQPQSPLRFVVLHHTGGSEKPDHFDLCLEMMPGDNGEEKALLEWSSQQPIKGSMFTLNPNRWIRRKYLVYEGPMSRGRGSVQRVDQGVYAIEASEVCFQGDHLQGRYQWRKEMQAEKRVWHCKKVL